MHILQADLEKHFEAGLHSIHTGDIQNSRFIAAGCFLKHNFLLRDEVWGFHIPSTEQCRTAFFKIPPRHKNDSHGHWPKHPLMGIGTEEIDELDIEWRGTKGLYGIKRKQDSLRSEHAADCFDIDSASAQVVTGCQRDQFGSRRQSGFDEFRSDFPRLIGMQFPCHNTARGEGSPRIHIRRVVVSIVNNLITGLPIEPICKQAQPKRSRPEQCDFIGIRANELCAERASAGDIPQDLSKFLMLVTTRLRMGLHGIRRSTRENCHTGVAKKNSVFDNRKLPPALGLVFEKSHFLDSSASWMSDQKSLVFATSPSSSSIGRFERKRKSRIVFL